MPAWAEWPRYRLGALCGLDRLSSGWYCRGRTGLVVVRRLGGTVMKQTRQVLSVRLSAIAFALIASQGAFAQNDESGGCVGLPSQARSEEHTSELQSHSELVCRLLLEK